MPDGLKKWFMLQIWRLQQVAQILTLALLAINLSLMLYDRMAWREGLFETPYTGVLVILLILAAAIWGFSIYWDLRMKMWREQATVLVERNPYVKEKMSSKEIAIYALVYLPLLENLAKNDPKLRGAVDSMKEWLRKAALQDANTSKDLDELLAYIGTDRKNIIDFDKGKR